MEKKTDLIVAVDFDGTCVSHEFPAVGNEIGAAPVLKAMVDAGCRLILFTMRSDVEEPTSEDVSIHLQGGKFLTEAVQWFEKHGIPLYGIQTNPTQHTWTASPKAYAQMYIDDCALGVPLKMDENISKRPFVDWNIVRRILEQNDII